MFTPAPGHTLPANRESLVDGDLRRPHEARRIAGGSWVSDSKLGGGFSEQAGGFRNKVLYPYAFRWILSIRFSRASFQRHSGRLFQYRNESEKKFF